MESAVKPIEDQLAQKMTIDVGGDKEKPVPRQSPVDIRSSEVLYDEQLAKTKLRIDYNHDEPLTLKHVSNGFQVCFPENSKSILKSTHLQGEYRLVQFHAHWSTKPLDGSEHLIEGLRAEAELHLVHMNTKYKSFEECLKYPDGLCVVGVFLDERKDDNPDLEPLVCEMNKIGPNSSVQLKGLNIIKLIPESREFYSYEGSLTTPPYSECVQWIVMKNPVYISTRQLRRFHSVKVGCNAREVHPLYGRVIKSSFKLNNKDKDNTQKQKQNQ